MQRCQQCGSPVEFRFIDGRCTPLHTAGGCGAARGNIDDSRLRRSPQSECRKTNCPSCKEPVYFVRHNGGSVWLDAPLGPPWDRHPCFDTTQSAEKPAQIISPELRQQLGVKSGTITGVVRTSEVSKDRRLTILEIVVGDSEAISLLIKGGADILTGRMAIIDSEQLQIYDASNPIICFRVTAALAGPGPIIGKGGPLFLPGSKPDMRKLNDNIEHGILTDAQHLVLKKHRNDGLDRSWKFSDLLILILLLKDKDQDLAIHFAAILVLEHAEAHWGCSNASRLAASIPPHKQRRLASWFLTHSPINIKVEQDRILARMQSPKRGTPRPFLVALARKTPI